jgi:hypothetical protein
MVNSGEKWGIDSMLGNISKEKFLLSNLFKASKSPIFDECSLILPQIARIFILIFN